MRKLDRSLLERAGLQFWQEGIPAIGKALVDSGKEAAIRSVVEETIRVHTCFAHAYQETDEKKQLFTPIGSFLSRLLETLAWEDASLRSLAEYFVLAELLGSGQGGGKIWPLTVLSGDLVEKLRRGGCLVSGERWNEWSMAL